MSGFGAAPVKGEAPKPAAAALPTARAPTAAVADESDAVLQAVNAWASAWSRKDVKGYLSQYASDFKTPKGIPRKAWEEEREDRIAGKPGKISAFLHKYFCRAQGFFPGFMRVRHAAQACRFHTPTLYF